MNAPAKPITLTISALAREFDVERDEVRRWIARANVQPIATFDADSSQSDLVGGVADDKVSPIQFYRLRDVIAASRQVDIDPDRMTPLQRKQHYQSQREELRLQEESGNLMSRIEAEEEQARIAKIVVQALETLPDILERDCGLSGAPLEKVEQTIDRVRDEIYEQLVAQDTAPRDVPPP